jgi:hypothetical protein
MDDRLTARARIATQFLEYRAGGANNATASSGLPRVIYSDAELVQTRGIHSYNVILDWTTSPATTESGRLLLRELDRIAAGFEPRLREPGGDFPYAQLPMWLLPPRGGNLAPLLPTATHEKELKRVAGQLVTDAFRVEGEWRASSTRTLGSTGHIGSAGSAGSTWATGSAGSAGSTGSAVALGAPGPLIAANVAVILAALVLAILFRLFMRTLPLKRTVHVSARLPGPGTPPESTDMSQLLLTVVATLLMGTGVPPAVAGTRRLTAHALLHACAVASHAAPASSASDMPMCSDVCHTPDAMDTECIVETTGKGHRAMHAQRVEFTAIFDAWATGNGADGSLITRLVASGLGDLELGSALVQMAAGMLMASARRDGDTGAAIKAAIKSVLEVAADRWLLRLGRCREWRAMSEQTVDPREGPAWDPEGELPDEPGPTDGEPNWLTLAEEVQRAQGAAPHWTRPSNLPSSIKAPLAKPRSRGK